MTTYPHSQDTEPPSPQAAARPRPDTPVQPHSERGVALVLAIFMIALSAIMLVSLADSTYVTMRLNSATERRVQAEFILKSAINLARVLIKNDITPENDDPTQDAWMQFNRDNAEIPGELLGIAEPNVRISLFIGSLTGKFPMQALLNSGQPNKENIEILARLLNNLPAFTTPPRSGSSGAGSPGSGAANQRTFTPEQLVANIVDYLDTDQNSFSPVLGLPGGFQGIEGDLNPDEPLRNDTRFDSLASELALVPGFTADKVSALLPYIDNSKSAKININSAQPEVIRALDPQITPEDAGRIVDFRTSNGPFTRNEMTQQLSQLIDPSLAQRLAARLVTRTQKFQVIAKVDYGTSKFMATAELDNSKSAGRVPDLKALMLY